MGCFHTTAASGTRVVKRVKNTCDQQRAVNRITRLSRSKHYFNMVAQEAEVVALRFRQLSPRGYGL